MKKISKSRLKFPAPVFGGKSTIAGSVWDRLGDVDNAVEPFCYSAAWLLNRPHLPRIETVNDLNPFVSNFWRAVKADPEEVAYHCDHPVLETCLHARHRWLVLSPASAEWRERMKVDPDYFDAKVAGWWIHGSCCWIGSGWCDSPAEVERNSGATPALQHHGLGDGVVKRKLSMPGRDVHSGQSLTKKRPRAHSQGGLPGVVNERGHLADNRRPMLGQAGIGLTVGSVGGEMGICESRARWLIDWMQRLADRMRFVRVCCGHWLRVCDSDTVTTQLGVTGLFLDPPYAIDIERMLAWVEHWLGNAPAPELAKKKGKNRDNQIYANDKLQDVDRLVAEVHFYCRQRGGLPGYRIALCGYEGEHNALESLGWDVLKWDSGGGYSNNKSANNANRKRERVWFSPHCIRVGLFD